MLRILVQGAVRARIHASWTIVQRASLQPNWRNLRECKLNMDGGENSLVGGCKAFHKGGGYWLIVVNDQLTGNIPKALEMMKVRREQASTSHGA